MSNYFGNSPDSYEKPLSAQDNLSDLTDKAAARTNLGVASADDVLKAANPIGTIIAFYGSVAPYGYLPCSGQTVSSSTFPSLVTFLGGTTSATLPDLRGEFLRGWDNGRGIDTGRAIRTWQADDFKSHTHALPANTAVNTAGGGIFWSGGTNGVSSTGPTAATGGTETRSRNVSVLYCIKAYDSPVSAGTLNIASIASQIDLKTALADFTGSNQSLTSTSGYQKMPGGMIIQWGLTLATSAGYLVTFPIAFPNTPVALVFGQNEASTSFHDNYLITTGFKYKNAAATYPDSFNWIVIGY